MTHMIDNLLSHTGDTALRRRAKWILEKIEQQNPKSILDVGCGDGFYLHLLHSLFPKAKIIGVDMDKNALKSASLNVKGKNVKLKYGDARNLKFKDSSFDTVLASEILEHLEDDSKGLKNICRVLKPGGLVLISVPHSNYPLLWDPINWFLEKIFNIHIKTGFWAGIWNQHLRLYSRQQLLQLLKKEKFENINSEVLTCICLPFNHHLLNIFARILSSRKNVLTRTSINKFTGNKDSKTSNLFKLLFLFDKLNERFKSTNTGVSVVMSAMKP